MPKASEFTIITAGQVQLTWVVPIVSPDSANNIITAAELRAFILATLGTAAFADTGTAPGNVPVLDGSGKLSQTVVPAIALNSLTIVADQAARLALSGTVGDLVKQTDNGLTYFLAALPASTDSNWIPIGDTTIVASDIVAGTIDPARLPRSISAFRPSVAVSASKTFTLADAGTKQLCSNASAITLTVPPQASVAWEADTEIDLVSLAAGSVTIAAGAGVTINRKGSGALQLSAPGAPASLIRTALNTWWLLGDLL